MLESFVPSASWNPYLNLSMTTTTGTSVYPAVDRYSTGYINGVGSEAVCNGSNYVCLVPLFNRLVQNSAVTGSFAPMLMETATQTPPVVSLELVFFEL